MNYKIFLILFLIPLFTQCSKDAGLSTEEGETHERQQDRGCKSANCECKLTATIINAPQDRNGNIKWIKFSWSHTIICDFCSGETDQKVTVYDDNGNSKFISALRSSPATVDLEWRKIKVDEKGYIIVACRGDCDHNDRDDIPDN